jgi:hypothetical protein
MTVFSDPTDQFIESVNQCLDMIEWGLSRQTPDGGIYGYPSMILLISILDAITLNLPKSERKKLNIDDMDLGILAYPDADFGIPRDQIRNLWSWYRNKLVHMNLIVKNASLKGEENANPFEFSPNGDLSAVYVPTLYRRVKTFWDSFDKSKFQSPDLSGPSICAEILSSNSLSSKATDVHTTSAPAASAVLRLG